MVITPDKGTSELGCTYSSQWQSRAKDSSQMFVRWTRKVFQFGKSSQSHKRTRGLLLLGTTRRETVVKTHNTHTSKWRQKRSQCLSPKIFHLLGYELGCCKVRSFPSKLKGFPRNFILDTIPWLEFFQHKLRIEHASPFLLSRSDLLSKVIQIKTRLKPQLQLRSDVPYPSIGFCWKVINPFAILNKVWWSKIANPQYGGCRRIHLENFRKNLHNNHFSCNCYVEDVRPNDHTRWSSHSASTCFTCVTGIPSGRRPELWRTRWHRDLQSPINFKFGYHFGIRKCMIFWKCVIY